MIGMPSISMKALFSPIRVLLPPERMIPVILFIGAKSVFFRDIVSDNIYYVNFYFSALNNFLQPSSFPSSFMLRSSNSLRISSCLFVKSLGVFTMT